MGLKAKDKAIVLCLVILAILVFAAGRYRDTHTAFTTEKWIKYEGNSRQLMLQDLMDRTRFVGMTRAEAKALLGEAEEETDAFLNYYLGMPRGLFGTKPDGEVEYLLLKIDTADSVTASGVETGWTLPKESIHRIIGEATENTKITPTAEES